MVLVECKFQRFRYVVGTLWNLIPQSVASVIWIWLADLFGFYAPIQALVSALWQRLLLAFALALGVYFFAQATQCSYLVRIAIATVQLQNPLGNVIKEIAVMGNRHDGARIIF